MLKFFFKGKTPAPHPPTTSSPPLVPQASSPAPKRFSEEIEKAHQTAMESGEAFYKDPASGYTVMTESYLRQRGFCCQSGCRHCPYGFKN